MKRVLIVGLDTFAEKNISQIVEMNKNGYNFDVLTNDLRSNSEINFRKTGSGNKIFILKSPVFVRIQLLINLISHTKYNHVELYSAGRMALIYLFLLRYFKLKILLIERGDIGILDSYSPFLRFVIKLSYRLSDMVLYKEPYMKELLDRYSAKQLTFSPNAAPPLKPMDFDPKKLDFVWVNRIISQRRADWFVDCLSDPFFSDTKNAIIGLEKNVLGKDQELQNYIESNKPINTELIKFSDPHAFYKSARFFVLPSTIVFGNNSLLEAMSYGVVPIVSKTDSTDLIIKDGINGIVVQHSKEGLLAGMRRALSILDADYEVMSKQAQNTIEQDFSLTGLSERLARIYSELGNE
jgi:glycosyltransferase involved in cell wall biosynthesis